MNTRIASLLAVFLALLAPLSAQNTVSARGGAPVQLNVTNNLAHPVRMIWIDQTGAKQDRGLLSPGAQTTLDTKVGHAWEFNYQRQVIKAYTATAKPSQFLNLGGAQPVPVATPKPAPPAGGAQSPEIAEFLQIHNTARAKVGAPPLRWSAKLATYAQQWADQLAAQGGNLVHRQQTQYGENLFGGSAGFTPADAANAWLSEKKFYRGGPITAQIAQQAGHYTQMVWAASTQVGFATATTRRGGVVIVANYSPAGNVLGQSPY